MPPTNIVRDIRTRIQNQLVLAVPKRWVKQFNFGLKAYGLQAFQSAAGNARMVVTRPGTAARKSERLFLNTSLTDTLTTVFDSLNLVKPSSYVNIDHSDMNGLVYPSQNKTS